MVASAPHVSALISDMAQGQRAALERFYDRYIQLVYNLVLRIVRNRADADEVVQEVFLQAWRHAGRYGPTRGTPEAWLVTLARAGHRCPPRRARLPVDADSSHRSPPRPGRTANCRAAWRDRSWAS
jgi:RNA polymerase sigma-70 factor (ECF subfamily)